MPHEVVMPQLGMAQDTGLIVAWHKAPGDAVAAGDVLMEVETDKATMEVPAGRDGVLAEIRAEAGREVPIGEVIAIIAADAAEAAEAAAAAKEAGAGEATDAPAAGESATTQAQQTATPTAAPAGTSGNGAAAGTPAPQTGGNGGRVAATAPTAAAIASVAAPSRAGGERVFASPKARRLAAERGIALHDLISAGATEPILVADLDRAPPQPTAATIPAEAAATAPQAAAATLTASAARSAFDALLASADPAPSRAAALAAFAAGALRAATGAETVTVACRTLGAAAATLTDPDRSGLTRLAHDPEAGAADLVLVDLSASRLTGYRPAGGSATLTATADGAERYMLTLTFDEAALPLETAAAFLDDLARRVEDPIRHLL